jgi:flagellar FliL protein
MSEPQAQPVENAEQGKKGILPKLLVGLFVAGIIIAECAAAYLLLPSPEEVSATYEEPKDEHGGDEHASNDGEEGKDGHDGHGGDHTEKGHLAEVELGEFSVTLLQPEAGAAYRVDFKIGATVGEQNKEKFTEKFAACQQRFRDQVMVEVRNCELTDLTEAGLGLIKRRISEKSNALFGEPLVEGVFFSEFSLVEQ